MMFHLKTLLQSSMRILTLTQAKFGAGPVFCFFSN
jgi:hypothetical protein